MNRIKIFGICFLFPVLADAQMLSLEQALDTAWKRSLGLAMARNEAHIAAMQNTAGNAGMLPVITLNGGLSFSNNNIEQRFSNGTEISRNGVGASNSNASVAGSWVLFDGMRMFAERDRLQALQALGEQGILREALRVALNTRLAYYALAREQRLYNYYDMLQAMAGDVARLAALRNETGMGSALNQLQAESAFELWKGRLREQEGRIREAREQLAFTMTVNSIQVQQVYDADTAALLPGLDYWMEGLRQHPDLQAAALNERVALASELSVKAQRMPQLRANGSLCLFREQQQGRLLPAEPKQWHQCRFNIGLEPLQWWTGETTDGDCLHQQATGSSAKTRSTTNPRIRNHPGVYPLQNGSGILSSGGAGTG